MGLFFKAVSKIDGGSPSRCGEVGQEAVLSLDMRDGGGLGQAVAAGGEDQQTGETSRRESDRIPGATVEWSGEGLVKWGDDSRCD